MLIKSAPVELKSVDADTGVFEAIVSVFGNKDSYGDIVMPGAFVESLAEWAASGDPIPMYWSHQMSDPDFNIGFVLEAKETDKGLWIKGQLDLDGALPGSKAPQVHRLMKGRRVTQFSFAYDIVEAGWVENDDDSWFELRKLKIHEVGPTPIGANQETELLAVKAASAQVIEMAAQMKAGRKLSADDAAEWTKACTAIAAQLKDVLTVIDGGEASNDSNAKDSEPAKDEETSGSKSEEPTRPSPADLSALLEIQLADAG